MTSLVDPGCQKLLLRLQRNPLWMITPKTWQWQRPDGLPQGFAGATEDEPGLANLLWLSMDMTLPPQRYDAGQNPLYCRMLLQAETSSLLGGQLKHWASLSTLPEFIELLALHAKALKAPKNDLERAYPLLKTLALRRIQRANP